MSFGRQVYYCAVIGGWAAFLGWGVAELLGAIFGVDAGASQTALIAFFVGALIGAGISIVSELSNRQWKRMWPRLALGAAGGGLLGCLGGLLGHALFGGVMTAMDRAGNTGAFATLLGAFMRAIGWTLMGAGVGVVCGLADFSTRRLKNGLIGGVLGGFIGGILFDPLVGMIAGSGGGANVSARATGFVILGVLIGLLIGFVQVVLREAWITVLDGYGPGRQLILDRAVTVLGRADHLPLPFIGPGNAELDPQHAQIERLPSGTFQLEDKGSRLGTIVNHKQIHGPTTLQDGDVIKVGRNYVRFNIRKGKSPSAVTEVTALEAAQLDPNAPQKRQTIAPPPPAPKKSPKPAGTNASAPQAQTTAAKPAVIPPKKTATATPKPTATNIPKPPPPPGKK